MVNRLPQLNGRDVFNVKETCAHLEISKDTLNDRRKRGLISAIKVSKNRYRYTGAAIRRFWLTENKQEEND